MSKRSRMSSSYLYDSENEEQFQNEETNIEDIIEFDVSDEVYDYSKYQLIEKLKKENESLKAVLRDHERCIQSLIYDENNEDIGEDQYKCHQIIKYYQQKDNENNEKIKKLKKKCKQLKEERDQQIEELNVINTEIVDLKRIFKSKLKKQQKRYDLLVKENNEMKKETEDNNEKYFELDKKYNNFEIDVNRYKMHKKFEIKQLKDDLDNEKKKNISVAVENGLSEKNIELIISLRIDIENHVKNENNLKETIDEWEKKYNDLTEKLDSNSEIDNLLNENKSNKFYESRIDLIKNQKKYWENISNQNKRKLLASQYITIGHEEILRMTAPNILTLVENNREEVMTDFMAKYNIVWNEIYERVQNGYNIQIMHNFKRELNNLWFETIECLKMRNTNDINEVVRNNCADIERIHVNADKINDKRKDGSVQCPECDRGFEGLPNLKTHLTTIHKKRFDSYFGSQRE